MDRDRHVFALSSDHRSGGRLGAAAGALLAATLLAACGSSGASGGTSGGSSSGGSSGSGTGTVMVGTVNGYGSVLVTASGRPLYILSSDPTGSSRCTGACAKTWRPLTVSGSPHAGSGVTSSLISSFTRSDGTTQVLYNKHALYTHAGSASSAAGTASDGGVWYLISAKGAAVKSTTSGGY
jgi:predicted lipoprotein with Yx(FWY)xxD motif